MGREAKGQVGTVGVRSKPPRYHFLSKHARTHTQAEMKEKEEEERKMEGVKRREGDETGAE